ncbi:hypothetical protein DH2020_031752 [Rehmannia glutinosa]|uniref:Uncharacterized protein n=1 Tax=Rehmannia glutinosa TaxID=99300 RepID=A0ABR0VH77_REHGL
MAKNRNKKKKNGSNEMAVDVASANQSVRNESQAMDTSETVASSVSVGGHLRSAHRSKNVRKMKAIAKAVSLSEKSEEKISKTESKTLRTKFAKNLYD